MNWDFWKKDCPILPSLMFYFSDSVRHWSQDICPPISHIVLKNFINICLIIIKCPEEILIKLAIVRKISKSSWNTIFRLATNSFLFNNPFKVIIAMKVEIATDHLYSLLIKIWIFIAVTNKWLVARPCSIYHCNMNAFFSFNLLIVYIPECMQQLRTMK